MSAETQKLSPLVKLGLDLGPLVVFFVLLLRVDIYAAKRRLRSGHEHGAARNVGRCGLSVSWGRLAVV